MAQRPVGFAPSGQKAKTAPLFARIPVAAAERLDRAAFELRLPKQDIVAGLVNRYVDPRRREALNELRVTVGEQEWPVGRAWSRESELREVLTLEEVAELLRVEVETVRRLVQRGELPGRKVGREWRFSRDAILEWVREPPDHAESSR